MKINMEKAYDGLRWDFIRDTLEEARFLESVIRLVMKCVTTLQYKCYETVDLLLNLSLLEESGKVTLYPHTFLSLLWKGLSMRLRKQ